MKETMYSLGMICRAIWPDLIEKPPLSYFDKLSQPATLLALMLKHPANTKDKDELICDLVGRLPADFRDPKGGVKAEDMSAFWLGYYHLDEATEAAKTCGKTELEIVGQALFGERWQTDLSRDLGLSDARRVRQWMSGERSIPVGVWADITQMLRQRQLSIERVISRINV